MTAIERVLVVTKRTSYQRLVTEGRDPRVLQMMAEGHASAIKMKAAHDAHQHSVQAVHEMLIDAGYAPVDVGGPSDTFDETGAVLVVTVGGDGTLLAASHHTTRVPILGVNSAPSHSVGHFCGATEATLPSVLLALREHKLSRVSLARMRVSKNGALVSSRVLNDALFCHASPAATSRYTLRIGDELETQRSSGFWIGPPAGSTAAQRSAGGDVLPLASHVLQLVVREPYDPEGRPLALAKRVVSQDEQVVVESRMHDARMFLDGPNDETEVSFGDVVVFGVSEEPLTLLGVDDGRSRN